MFGGRDPRGRTRSPLPTPDKLSDARTLRAAVQRDGKLGLTMGEVPEPPGGFRGSSFGYVHNYGALLCMSVHNLVSAVPQSVRHSVLSF